MTTPDVQRPVPRGSGPGSTATGRHTASSLRTDTAMVLVSGIGGTPVHAELRYRCDDPFAVQLRLSIPGSQLVIWTVGRDLLSTVSPSPAVWVTCTSIPPAAASSSNSARRHPPRGWSPTGAALQAFLAAAASPVPPGTEIDHYTLDEELLRIQHG